MNILLTGGTGYIGSHVAIALSRSGHRTVLFDNLSNSAPNMVNRLMAIIGQSLSFVRGDTRDTALLQSMLREHRIEAVVHCAGLKVMGESISLPIDDYANNVQGTISLLQAMQAEAVNLLLFSSSAAVYGEPQYLPIDEEHPTGTRHPYGRTVDLTARIADVAAGRSAELNVFGSDYSTSDGTGIRESFKLASRRPEDVASCYANPDKAKRLLAWEARYVLDDMCGSTWKYQISAGAKDI